MTKHEAAVVMAFTGTAFLIGDDLDIFYRYVSNLMRRPVHTHELPDLADEIKERAKPDMLKICKSLTDDVRVVSNLSFFDKEEVIENCTVHVYKNSKTGDISYAYTAN